MVQKACFADAAHEAHHPALPNKRQYAHTCAGHDPMLSQQQADFNHPDCFCAQVAPEYVPLVEIYKVLMLISRRTCMHRPPQSACRDTNADGCCWIAILVQPATTSHNP